MSEEIKDVIEHVKSVREQLRELLEWVDEQFPEGDRRAVRNVIHRQYEKERG